MKIECSYKVAKNFWDYYLLKWGIKKKIKIHLKTLSSDFILDLPYDLLMNSRLLFKVLFRCIKDSRLEYNAKTNKFIIYDKNKINKKEFDADIFYIETIDRSVEISNNIQEYDKDFFLIEVNGVKFLIRKRVFSDVEVIKENFIDEQYSFIYPFIKDAVVIDVGANIGDTAISFCQKGAKIVYAYEPHPFFFGLATKNVQLNGLDKKIIIKPYGIGAEDSVLKIKDDTVFGPTGRVRSEKTNENDGIEIKIVPFSKIIEDVKNVDVLKMDCEGAEFEAILSCPIETIKKIKVMAIEFHRDPSSIIDYLKKNDFSVEVKKENATEYEHTGLLFAMKLNL